MENQIYLATPASSAVSDDAPRPTDENSFADILSEFEQQHNRPNSEALEGTVVSVQLWNRSSWTLLDERPREFCRLSCFATHPASPTIKPGDRLRVTVTGRDPMTSTLRIFGESGAAQGLERSGTRLRRTAGDRRCGDGTARAASAWMSDPEPFMPASRSGAGDPAEPRNWLARKFRRAASSSSIRQRRCGGRSPRGAGRRGSATRAKEVRRTCRKWAVRGIVRSLITDFGAFVDLAASTDCCTWPTWPATRGETVRHRIPG